MPLSHLIALICNAHHTQHPTHFPRQRRSANHHALYVVRIVLERPGLIYAITQLNGPRINRPEVNQTKPELPLSRKIRADSAGYAPQALVPLYDVI